MPFSFIRISHLIGAAGCLVSRSQGAYRCLTGGGGVPYAVSNGCRWNVLFSTPFHYNLRLNKQNIVIKRRILIQLLESNTSDGSKRVQTEVAIFSTMITVFDVK